MEANNPSPDQPTDLKGFIDSLRLLLVEVLEFSTQPKNFAENHTLIVFFRHRIQTVIGNLDLLENGIKNPTDRIAIIEICFNYLTELHKNAKEILRTGTRFQNEVPDPDDFKNLCRVLFGD